MEEKQKRLLELVIIASILYKEADEETRKALYYYMFGDKQ